MSKVVATTQGKCKDCGCDVATDHTEFSYALHQLCHPIANVCYCYRCPSCLEKAKAAIAEQAKALGGNESPRPATFYTYTRLTEKRPKMEKPYRKPDDVIIVGKTIPAPGSKNHWSGLTLRQRHGLGHTKS